MAKKETNTKIENKKDVIINGVKYIVYVEKEPAVRINQILHFKMLKNEENK